ncbi:acetate--CoA ligase [Candidatus Manganitrophus noduliformans]|uniref:Acetyl-coenzyme A synthetase n=1 Tax=Candidatus Manganitrophus noduliformans TaxID=2606439 RepID=A0A7X6I9K2_9BACT|nr:acetate--CoA ligase [Candidatus Manganitrophus noduliformans]NKE69501.1 acetate--CoA ligase [Candidatus Manganitrophus noduliformans]
MAREKEITSVLNERRLFKPKKEFSKAAHLSSLEAYKRLYRKAEKDPEAFWAGLAKELSWFKPWKKVLEWKPPFAKWFVGGKINIAYNCLDRHLEGWRKNKAAIIWEGEPGDSRVLTYQDLHREVSKFANVLKGQGVVKGDRVAIYMPMIPELAIAMLACARIGATHSIIFGGFSATALRDRINDAEARLVVTADGGYRKGEVVTLKEKVDEALKETPGVQRVVVVRRTNTPVEMQADRDFWWHDLMKTASDQCSAEALDSEHPLFILYTSGTTGKPKGIVHTTAGYLLGTTVTARWIFDLKETDTYWCTADIGWVTGHSYVIYGILSNGVTTVMYEGAPTYPQPDRIWEIIDKYKVNILYTAPTAIRALIKMGEEWPKRHDLSSLRLLGTVGEPINPEAWMWYHQVIGKGRSPIVDTWWQTETGAIMITPLPGAIPTKPGSATLPFPGIAADVVNREGESVPANVGGYLVIKRPWPSMLRTVWKDPERYKKQYWSDIPGVYFTGDGARRDKDGYFWVMGRVDDVINVAGHRLGTMEIESALVSHSTVAEAAVVGRPDELKGTAISAFVTLELGNAPSDPLKEALRAHVVKEIGAIARPDDIRFTENLPKTRSGKIMRRLLRDIAAGRETIGDTTTLEDYTVLAKLRQEEE